MFFADALHVFQPIVIGDIILRALIGAKRLFWGKRVRRVIHLGRILNFGSLGHGTVDSRDHRRHWFYSQSQPVAAFPFMHLLAMITAKTRMISKASLRLALSINELSSQAWPLSFHEGVRGVRRPTFNGRRLLVHLLLCWLRESRGSGRQLRPSSTWRLGEGSRIDCGLAPGPMRRGDGAWGRRFI